MSIVEITGGCPRCSRGHVSRPAGPPLGPPERKEGRDSETRSQASGLPRPRRERPSCCRAAEGSPQFPPSDGDRHTPLPCEVRKGNDTTTRACSLHVQGGQDTGCCRRLRFKSGKAQTNGDQLAQGLIWIRMKISRLGNPVPTVPQARKGNYVRSPCWARARGRLPRLPIEAPH